MKKILIAFLFFGGLIMLQSCYYDNPPKPLPFDCEDVSYSSHVLPVFATSCATSQCHDGTKEPDLRPDVARNNLRNGYINLTFPEDSRLYKSVEYIANDMPPGGQLKELDRELILCWISEGALND
ncbi:MAG: hypothetical protein ACI9AT_000843 [Ulvibacter sp.]|jgi:hypothetical protein